MPEQEQELVEHVVPEEGPGRVQRCLDGFYTARSWMANVLAYLSLRVYGFEEISLAEVSHAAYRGMEHKDRSLEHVHDPDLIVAESKACLQNAQARRSAITDKCKTLFTLSSLLLGLIGVLLPKSLAFDALWMRVICFLAVLALLNTIVLLLTFFDVGSDTEVSLDQEQVDLEAGNFKKSLINLYLRCQVAMDNRTDYLVDLYKAARFFFLLAFTVVALLFSVNFLLDAPKNRTEDVIRALRSDPSLIELLRGPKGDIGPKGHSGDPGAQGADGKPGDKGDRGMDAILDEDSLIERILNDPRFKNKLDDAMQAKSKPQPAAN